ncbi:hypothetical protein BS50DRAFT_590808 [Corynespora cassiicola Philippines]|uniref:ferric-chelate reductase (NADPH) n=1 Tax=Corynespora cassiicola Philippines TaxID=1448308 RepID=A0A2T2NEC7_CORCC|nr:hypothetical protein BS50DRAFT_590808 [Corynespora cassiicola Philippines]
MIPGVPTVYAPEGWPSTPLPEGTSVEDLPITSPYCVNQSCRAFREDFAEDEKKTPLLGLLEYGTWTVWFYSFWVILFTSIYIYGVASDSIRQRRKRSHKGPYKITPCDKTVALLRFWTYRRPNNRFTRKLGLLQISYGTLTLLGFASVFFSIIPWPQQRYLRARFRFGSPPLSVRCAMVIAALTPLTIAMAGKVNVITWMTGVGYEKLNVVHRYTAYVIFYLATIHTLSYMYLLLIVPHLIAPVQDGGWSMLNKLYANQARELSGTVLYFVTFGLVSLSIPWIRRRFYEAFKYVHMFLGTSYIGVLWWHIHGEYMSPNYIYATVAVYLFSNTIRLFHRHHNLRSFSNLTGFPTTLTHLHGNVTRVAIEVPKSMAWKPGQHVFLRIPNISLLQNHPFSIANIPSLDKDRSVHEMVFLVRRNKGFTKMLFEYNQITSVHLSRLSSELTLIPDKTPTESGKTSTTDLNPPPLTEKKGLKGSTPTATTAKTRPTTNPRHTPITPPTPSLSPPIKSPISPLPPHYEPTYTSANPHTPATHPPLRTILDGPYGTHHRPLHAVYNTVLCIAAGTGITAVLPHVLDLARRLGSGDEAVVTQCVRLVWVVRDARWLEWVGKEVFDGLGSVGVWVEVYVTGGGLGGMAGEGVRGWKGEGVRMYYRRPVVGEVVGGCVVEGRNIVIGELSLLDCIVPSLESG